MRKAIVIGGSRGIGKAISDSLKTLDLNVVTTSTKEVDTSNLENVKEFINEQKETDVLVLNTGGPPITQFFDITEEQWEKYHKQLFVGFCLLLQKLKINDNGYIFLITSGAIKKPDPNLILSSAYRLAFTSVLKTASLEFASRNISCINLAPGPFKTDRLKDFVTDLEKFEQSLPMKRAGDPMEIGKFVKSIIENDIHYLSGVVINFDGGNSTHVL